MKLIVGVDVDEVCANLLGEWLRRYNRVYDDCKTPEDIRGWGMPENVKPECGARIYDILREPDLYDHILPIDGARGAVLKMREVGHRVVFVTSCTTGTTDAKVRWLERWGFLPSGPKVHKDFVACSDKALVNVDVLFDDNVETIERFPRAAYLVMVPHNQDVPCSKPRVHSLRGAPFVVEALARSPYRDAA